LQILLQAQAFFKGSHKKFPSVLRAHDLDWTLDLAARCLEEDAGARPPIRDVVSKMQEYMPKGIDTRRILVHPDHDINDYLS
jgi:hypothetical protein